MALNRYSLQMLAKIEFKTVLSLGYPDIVVSREELKEITGVDVEKSSTKAQAWHGAKDPLPDTEEFFSKIGATLTCTDFKVIRGNEIVVDLNFPTHLGEFDLVIDPGTIEHCFNISQAIFNAADAVKTGGYIVHVNPMSMVNHGFYNLSPTFYMDFYPANGFEILAAWGCGQDVEMNLPHKDRIILHPEMAAYVCAKRMEKTTFTYPIQAKYR